MHDPIDGKSVLVTGSTGSFGKRFTETIPRRRRPRRFAGNSFGELE